MFNYGGVPLVVLAILALLGWSVAFLKRTTQQLESTRVAAILLVIIGLVLLAELGSGYLRKKIGRMRQASVTRQRRRLPFPDVLNSVFARVGGPAATWQSVFNHLMSRLWFLAANRPAEWIQWIARRDDSC